jgi:hypothetical protein
MGVDRRLYGAGDASRPGFRSKGAPRAFARFFRFSPRAAREPRHPCLRIFPRSGRRSPAASDRHSSEDHRPAHDRSTSRDRERIRLLQQRWLWFDRAGGSTAPGRSKSTPDRLASSDAGRQSGTPWNMSVKPPGSDKSYEATAAGATCAANGRRDTGFRRMPRWDQNMRDTWAGGVPSTRQRPPQPVRFTQATAASRSR